MKEFQKWVVNCSAHRKVAIAIAKASVFLPVPPTNFFTLLLPIHTVIKSMAGFFNKLKQRWGIKSNFQIILILIVFSLAGSSVLVVEAYIFKFIGLAKPKSLWLKLLVALFTTFPLHQLLLLIYGTLLGQFRFFWNFSSQIFSRLFFFLKRRKP